MAASSSIRSRSQPILITLVLIALVSRVLADTTISNGLPISDSPILNCSTPSDNYVGNAQTLFTVDAWIRRGLCLRQGAESGSTADDFVCYSRLQNVLENNLNEIRKAEYAGAAGVLALLPTIGALLGTPTNEIWRLLTMIPFGGFIAMACSFGGAILPVKIKDYESKFMQDIRSGLRGGKSHLSLLRSFTGDTQGDAIRYRANQLLDRVESTLRKSARKKVESMYILVGLTGMTALLLSAQAAMIIVELGAVLPWWCVSKWWMHLWYMMVLVTAAFDSYVQLPFSTQWRLCLSDVPYDLVVEGDEYIVKEVPDDVHDVQGIRVKLQQMPTMKSGTVHFTGLRQWRAEPINVLFVQVSVTNHKHDWRTTFIRSLSKIMSIGVFIVGTACFASAQLLSVAMATFVLTCVLGAGVFGRAITSWIVSGIDTAEPMIQYVADTEDEALYAMSKLFTIKPEHETGRKVQVEIQGHVFLDGRKIRSRSPWPSRIWGVLAEPLDLRKCARSEKFPESGLLLSDMQRPSDGDNATKSVARPPMVGALSSDTDMSVTSSVYNGRSPQIPPYEGLDARVA